MIELVLMLTPYRFDILSNCQELIHGVFSRHGGVSQKPFDSLNVGLTHGDAPENVAKNIALIQAHMNVSEMVSAIQMHGNEVKVAAPSLRCDALVTQQPNLGLLVKHADCQAAIFYDPIQKVLAVVHCGWRGNVLNIYRETLSTLKHHYGSNAKNVLVGISPSLGPEAAEFIHYEKELPSSFWPFQVKPLYFDFWEISRWQLELLGVLPHHIEIAKICTYHTPKNYFSYRRCKRSGRHATVAALRPLCGLSGID